ncbi:MAG: tetratricopeptide repeat protein [Brevinema sp.]
MKTIFKKICLMLLIPAYAYSMSLDKATFQVGQRFLTQKLYTEAELRFLDVVRKYPDSQYYRQSLFYLGQIYANQGKYESALQYYKILMNKSRTVKERQLALLGVAKSWLQLGVHDKAAQFYSFFASEYPESEHAPVSLYFAGIAREREGKNSAAVEKFRAVIQTYPETAYYAKSIEKLAVLETQTPEELFIASSSKTTPQKNKPTKSVSDVQLFGDDEFNLDEVPGFNNTDFRAQSVNLEPSSSNPVPPSVITQVILQQSPPTILTQMIEPTVVTQKIVETITQFIEQDGKDLSSTSNQTFVDQVSNTAKKLSSDVQKLIESSAIYLSNNQFFPIENAAQRAHREELEAYKQKWEQEFKAKLKSEEVQNAEQSVKDLLQLTQSKAEVLSVKEADLADKKNKIQGSIYQELKKINSEYKPKPLLSTPPAFTGVPSTKLSQQNITTNTQAVLAPTQTPTETTKVVAPQDSVVVPENTTTAGETLLDDTENQEIVDTDTEIEEDLDATIDPNTSYEEDQVYYE